MSGDLLTLALQAMEDPDALEVFADAVLEQEWFDERPAWLITPSGLMMIGGWQKQYAIGAKRDRHHPGWKHWPTACAAVLLFGGWSTTRWPLVAAAKLQTLHQIRNQGRFPTANGHRLR